MDRTAYSAWIGVGSLVVCGLGLAGSPCAADSGLPIKAATQPGLLNSGTHTRPAKPLKAAPPRTTINPIAIAATHRPPVEAAQPPVELKRRDTPRPLIVAPLPELSTKNPVRAPVVEAAEPLEGDDEESAAEVEGATEELAALDPAAVEAAQPVEPLEAPAPKVAPRPPVAAPQANSAPEIVAPQDDAHTLMPWAHANPRSPEMMAVLQRVNDRLKSGFLLARRAATYSARAEFVAALKMIAEANDEQQQTRIYTTSLTNGLTALREAGVFVDHPADRAGLSVERIVAGHKTKLLKDEDLTQITPLDAASRYYAYAQEQLAAAAAQEPLGSMALFGMAKSAAAMTTSTSLKPQQRIAQEITLYRAALLAAPQNFLAANELAVVEVRNGNLHEARDLLMQSATASNQPATWHNLVTIHTRLGETELARQAKERLSVLPQPKTHRGLPPVEWLDANAFAQTTPPTEGLVAPDAHAPTAAPAAAPAPAPAARPRENVAKQGLSDWLPWNPRR
jgi:hypothetical protein